MGFLDFLTSTRRPAAGVPVLSPEQVKQKLLAVNRPTAPYRIVDGKPDGVDVVAEWKVVDAQWYQIFEKAGYKKTFRILMKLDPEKHEVRAQDRELEVSWSAGIPTLSFAMIGFRGQKQEISFGQGYAFTEELRPGQVYNYRFNTKELKQPLQDAITSSGWTYKGVVKL
ncbi:MAG TPA: hypothetical protein VF505_12035 [Thermoanaerobaculia bacterium]